MTIIRAPRIELQDEGVVQGRVRAINCVGAGINASVSGDVGTLTLGASGGAGLQYLASYSPVAVSSVDITSTYLTSTYLMYLIAYQLTVGTDDGKLSIRTDTSNGASVDAGASDYSWTLTEYSTGAGESPADSAAAQISLVNTGAGNGIGNATNESIEGAIWVRHLGSATRFPSFQHESVYLDTASPTRTCRAVGTGHRRLASTINFIRLFTIAGNITGEVRLYGLRAS